MIRKQYYWIVASDPETNQPYLLFGSDNSEEEARQKGLELLPGIDFQLKRFPTRDKDTASAFLRGVRLEKTHSLKEATRRIGHNKSLKRMRRKYSANNY